MYYLGIDLGGTNIAIGLVNEEGEIVERGNAPTGRERSATMILKDMAELAQEVAAKAGVGLTRLAVLGLVRRGSRRGEWRHNL